ncbi:MAG: murein L,D-transpeptidase catalytic domain family protein [Acidobacteriota bacterium]
MLSGEVHRSSAGQRTDHQHAEGKSLRTRIATLALLALTAAALPAKAQGPDYITKNLRYTKAAIAKRQASAKQQATHPGGTAVQLESLLSALTLQAPDLRPDVLRIAFNAAQSAASRGLVKRTDLLTVIDYTLPSSQPRLFVFDLAARKLLFRELVAHGKNSGGDRATFFSNKPESLATSLGLFVTADPYIGSHGYSLRLRGLQTGVNDKAWDRHIVMHGAAYVSSAAIRTLGRLGRSFGCPAVRPEISRAMIEKLRGGSPVFAYYSTTHG